MNLEQAASSMLEQYPTGAREDIKRQERALEKFGNITFAGFGVVLGVGILGIIYTVITKMILSGTQPLAGILLVLFIVFAALSLGYVIWRESLNEKKQKVSSTHGPQIGNGEAPEKLLGESTFEHVPSVTEDTTELLVTKRDTRKLD